tara:strand:+ start:348 stop:488 length:141 start_codon:yes stop_codon:yes gene_type:complete
MRLSASRLSITSSFQAILLVLRLVTQGSDQLTTQGGDAIVSNIQDI